ncbi:MAG TPA: DUF2306 domain-containing protein [Rhizomicrobium sp.]|nr:DUF2306 domain-containing protein [Rhizomicrobium sp.]
MTYSLTGWVHIASASVALALGAFIIAVRKGTPIHRLAGLLYVFAMLLLNLSALSIYDMTGHFGPFHAGAIFSLVCVLIGVSAPILRNGNWLNRHYRWMGWSYFGLLAAGFAEAVVRVPALQVHTAARGFEVAIGATVLFSLFGRFFMRRLGGAVAKYRTRT